MTFRDGVEMREETEISLWGMALIAVLAGLSLYFEHIPLAILTAAVIVSRMLERSTSRLVNAMRMNE